MSTGAKIAIGCAVVVVVAGIVFVVALGGAAWWLKGKAEQVAGNIVEKSSEIEAYQKKANANPFTEPADGVLSEPRFLKFMEARRAVYDVYAKHEADFEAMKDKKEADLSDITRFAGFVTDVQLAQAKALAATGMSEEEYRFIQTAVYKSMWANATVKDTGRQPSELLAEATRQLGEAAKELEKVGPPEASSSAEKEVRDAEAAVSELAKSADGLAVPPANLELFRKHEAEIKKYAMSGLGLFGL
jgi:hypothetical protein